jgi:hypothetical protein
MKDLKYKQKNLNEKLQQLYRRKKNSEAGEGGYDDIEKKEGSLPP